jgi:two-component system chemotaxis sensor kinase CheA
MKEQELLRKLREAFRTEAEERLDSLTSLLTALEKAPDEGSRETHLQEIFREAHSLKGAARSVEYRQLECLCQAMENIFSSWSKGELAPDAEHFGLLHDCISEIERFSRQGAEDPAQEQKLRNLEDRLQQWIDNPRADDGASGAGHDGACGDDPDPKGTDARQRADSPQEQPPNGPVSGDSEAPRSADPEFRFSDTLRVSSARLDALLRKTEDLLSLKLALKEHQQHIREAVSALSSPAATGASLPQPRTPHLADPGPRAGPGTHASADGSCPPGLQQRIRGLDISAKQLQRSLEHKVDEMLDFVKDSVMLPFSSLFAALPRMVREMARDLGKEAELVVRGEEVAMDKRILERIKDPLVHILRNAVDHGLETPEERIGVNKERTGAITLSVSRLANSRAEIEVRDDGRGIEPERLRQKALQECRLSGQEMEGLSAEDCIGLIFRSGFSSRVHASHLSGRGLGMGIVQQAAELLGGEVRLRNHPGKGLAVALELPLTLATFRGVLVQAGEFRCVVPNANIRCAARVEADEIGRVEGGETVRIQEQTYSLFDLAGVLGLPGPDAGRNGGRVRILLLQAGESRMAFRVSHILTEQEILVKDLGKMLRRVPNFSGASVMGDGEVIPVLNVWDLVKTARGAGVGARSAVSAEEAQPGPKTVHVVEDTITSRMLLKNILEASGYRVRTAVDGDKAYRALQDDPADLVVSDVEMPVMDGIELTQRIRSHERLRDIPVILVTGMESDGDRIKGLNAGADAYIVKSSFDQSDLLQAVDRLI